MQVLDTGHDWERLPFLPPVPQSWAAEVVCIRRPVLIAQQGHNYDVLFLRPSLQEVIFPVLQMQMTCYAILCYFLFLSKYTTTHQNTPPKPHFFSNHATMILNAAIYSSSFTISGSSRSLNSSNGISSPEFHPTESLSTGLGGMSTLFTTWMTPSAAMPSEILTVEKPLILMLMKRP